MANWGSVIPIIVAIIGVSGVIIPAFSSTFNKPNINIDLKQSPIAPEKQYIDISNTGTVPATNLSLFLITYLLPHEGITSIKNSYSTVDLTLTYPSSHLLLKVGDIAPINGTHFVKIYVKKFVNGGGSIIRLDVCCGTGFRTNFQPVYAVYATYDQGSTRYPPLAPSMSDTYILFPPGLVFFYNNYTRYNTFIQHMPDIYLSGEYFYLAQSIVIVYLFYYFFIRRRKQRKEKFLERIKQEMMTFRRSVRNDPLSRKPFYDSWTEDAISRESFTKKRQYSAHLTMIKRKSKIISETNDYLRVDDFYSKLAERNSYIKSGSIDDNAFKELNKKCLDLAEDALEKIDWTKYK